jgi:phage baseplate assembly protein gpV/phage protein D
MRSGVHGLPDVTVEVDGAPLKPQLRQALIDVRVRRVLSQPTQLELTFEDPRLHEQVAIGARISVGIAGQDQLLAAGEVTACEHLHAPDGRHRLRVRGYDVLHRLRRRRPLRAHTEVTAADLARELIAPLGLTVRSEGSPPAWPFLIQSGPSDLDLLVDLAGRCGLYLVLEGDVLSLVSLAGQGSPKSLALGQELLEVTVGVSGEWSAREVRVCGWNSHEAKEHAGAASTPGAGLQVEAMPDPARLGGDTPWVIVDATVHSDEHAQALAQAELDRRTAATVVMNGLCLGDPCLRPGGTVELRSVHPAVAGRYVLVTVEHRIEARSGFVSQLSSEPPASRPRSSATTLALGRVTRIDDPQDLGRIRVALPTVGGVETDWLGVLAPGGGKQKGLVVQPDVGDTVLVQLPHDDPARAIVLGGLHGADGDGEGGGKSQRRYALGTSGGHLLKIDDQAQVIRIEHGTGSYLELGPREVKLHAARALVVEAPGQAVTIRGNTVDFEKK